MRSGCRLWPRRHPDAVTLFSTSSARLVRRVPARENATCNRDKSFTGAIVMGEEALHGCFPTICNPTLACQHSFILLSSACWHSNKWVSSSVGSSSLACSSACLACLPACLPACLLACLPARLLACSLACLLACLYCRLYCNLYSYTVRQLILAYILTCSPHEYI